MTWVRTKPLTLAALASIVALVSAARAQTGVDFTQPIVVLNTGGHHGPPRVILFTPDGSQVLTAGMDKVINIWNLGDGRPGLARTMRPAIWRGPAGIIYAMTMSAPIANEPGQRYLAVAGFGVENQRGNISLFRFPGSNDRPTGDILAQLASGRRNDPQPRGHIDTVSCLAFSPSSRYLVSGGNDARILIWDMRTRTVVGSLIGHTGPVSDIAFTRDGRYLVSGGKDGVVRVWDFANRRLTNSVNPWRRPGDDPRGDAINALAITPDGRWIVVGRENGLLLRYDLANLNNSFRLPLQDEQWPVEAIAISHDGTRLAVSVVAHPPGAARPGDPPLVNCEVEIRRLPDGALIGTKIPVDNLVYSLAFSPDDRLLVFAGGDAQGVTLKDLREPNKPVVEMKGQGRSIWDVGFSADSRSIGLTRSHPGRVEPAPSYEGFDLHARTLASFAQADLKRALTTWEGWSARPVDPLTLEVLNAGAVRFRVVLDPERDRRWWSYSFIPPGPAHARPTFAVGCEAGVAFYNLDDGKRTRLYAGHSGPVYALAPSPDGKWLVTGSSDQTARVWKLAGCDTLAPLGATYEKDANGQWHVATVDRLGFADLMGMKANDQVEMFIIGDDPPLTPDVFLARVGSVPPNTPIQFMVRRGAEQIPLGTTRRDAPVLALFLGLDREWVLWMPQGYYETSTDGDRRYLGWHRNGTTAARPTDYFAADKFERELRQPIVLTTLLQQADLGAALAAVAVGPARDPAQLAKTDGPPVIRIVGPPARSLDKPLVANAPAVAVRAIVETEGRRPIRELRVQVDGRTIGAPLVFDPPVAQLDRPLELPALSGTHRVNVVAVNDQGKERIEGFELDSPAPPPRTPRLAVLAIGAGGPFQDQAIPTIRFANEDAKDVSAFLSELGGHSFEQVQTYPVISGTSATSRPIQDALVQVEHDALGPGDTAFVLIEGYFVATDQGRYLIGTDAGAGSPPARAFSADGVADVLTKIAAQGCRVVLLLDSIHDPAPDGWNRPQQEWIRSLYRRGVITFVASNHGPSRRYFPKAHGAFVQGVLDAPGARGQARPWVDPNSAMTVDDFKVTVVERVKELTNLKQQAACYLPETFSARSPLFDSGRIKTSAEHATSTPAAR
jgi:WD40 repeat protein